MKYIFLIIFAVQCAVLSAMGGNGFTMQKDVAQYKGSDYSNVVQVARNISLQKAFEIAESNPDIDYFVYTKGYKMVLEVPPDVQYDPSNDPFGLAVSVNFRYDSGNLGRGYCRIFNQGDVVFFKKQGMWLGSAPGLADAYIKN